MFPCTRGRVVVVAEGGGGRRRSGDGGDRLERCVDGCRVESDGDLESSRNLESFGMKNETTRGELLFICSKISAAVLN
jgi:hypothetical protein